MEELVVFGIRNHNDVVFGAYPYVLPKHSVEQKLVAFSINPELIAVIEVARFLVSNRVRRGAFGYPIRGENSSPLKDSAA